MKSWRKRSGDDGALRVPGEAGLEEGAAGVCSMIAEDIQAIQSSKMDIALRARCPGKFAGVRRHSGFQSNVAMRTQLTVVIGR